MSIRILITGQTFTPDVLERLQDKGYEIEVRPEYLDEDGLIRALQGKDAYIVGGVEFASGRALEQAKDLKIVAVMGVGYQTFVDVATATKLGIAVTNTPNANSRATAEMAIGLIFAMKRKIPYISHLTKTGGWRDDIVTKNVYRETLGIVGMGAVGRIVAEIAQRGLGMEIVYHNRTPKPDIEASLKARRVSLDELLRMSDIVTLHCPLTEETDGMIGMVQLAMMKSSAILINVARAKLVQPEALAAALKEATIAGCAMDGYYIEPAPPPEKDPYGLLGLSDEKFLVTSHLAYLTEDSIRKMCELAADSIISLLSGGSWHYIVNPDYLHNRKW